MKRYLLFITVLFLTSVHAQEWTLKKDRNGIKVFTRKLKSSKFREYKVVMQVKTTADKALATILDGDNLWKWNYKTSKSKTVKKISSHKRIIWMKNDFNWPVLNRDNVSLLTVFENVNGSYRITIAPETSYKVSKEKNVIRVTNFKGYWFINPKGNHVEITHQIYGDPKGRLPSWVLNSVLTAAPYYSFKNLKRLLEN